MHRNRPSAGFFIARPLGPNAKRPPGTRQGLPAVSYGSRIVAHYYSRLRLPGADRSPLSKPQARHGVAADEARIDAGASRPGVRGHRARERDQTSRSSPLPRGRHETRGASRSQPGHYLCPRVRPIKASRATVIAQLCARRSQDGSDASTATPASSTPRMSGPIRDGRAQSSASTETR